MSVSTPPAAPAAAVADELGTGPRTWGFKLLGLVRIFIGFYFIWAFADKLIGLGFSTPSERARSEEHTSELQSRGHLVCRLLLEKKKTTHFSALSCKSCTTQCETCTYCD